jgi:hypothetical protein
MGERRVETITIEADNRDSGKVFIVTEMNALPTEKWALRALLAFGKSGGKLPKGFEGAATVALSNSVESQGMDILENLLKLDYDLIEPLLKEMLDCVQIKMPNMAMPRKLVANDIEEISTLLKLRIAVLNIHRAF